MRALLYRPLLFALAFGAFRIAAAQGPGRLMVGDVTSAESGAPLGHAMVTVLGMERQTFTSDGGVFAFTGIEPGKYRLRATHIGFVPAEFSVDFAAGNATPRIKISLKRFSVELAAFKVTASSACTRPGRPNADSEPDFAAVVGQLRLNAEHYQLLTDSFPFGYKMVRAHREMHGDSGRGPAAFDTLEIRTDGRGWEYKMGDVVEHTGNRGYIMHLPTLRDFASYEFLNNHCFRYAGVDSTAGGAAIRIEFRADIQIRTPDVNGSILLDAKTYQIRSAELQLTKILKELPQVTAVRVTTLFSEVSPSIVIIHDVNGITSLRHSRFRWSTIAETEEQRLVQFEWLRRNPAEPSP